MLGSYWGNIQGNIRVILGSYWSYMRVRLGLEFRVQAESWLSEGLELRGFRVKRV